MSSPHQHSDSAFSFGCPHCGAVGPVAVAQVGTVVACTACARPFRAEVPSGKVLSEEPPAPDVGHPVPEAAIQAKEPADIDPQTVILSLSPAVWRMRFAATCCDGALVAGGLGVAGFALLGCEPGMWRHFFLAGGGALWLVGAFNLAVPWIKSRGETLVVTHCATCWTTGLFKRRSVEIRHDAVRAVEVEQTLGQRLLGIGTLTLASDGSDQDEIVMKGVPGVKGVAGVIRGRMGR